MENNKDISMGIYGTGFKGRSKSKALNQIGSFKSQFIKI